MAYPERRLWCARSQRLGLLCVLTLPWCLAAAQTQTYRWVDEKGRVHYGDIMPPRANELTVLDKQGRVLRQPPLPQARMPLDAPAVGRKSNETDTARARQDRALLSTYVHEGEIDLARDRALAQELARRDSLQAMLKQAEARLSRLQSEAAAHLRAGRQVPEALRQSIAYEQGEIARLNERLERNAAARQEIEARYADYKARFRFLKGQGASLTPDTASISAKGDAAN